MNLREIRKRVKEVEEAEGNVEAHIKEDKLYRDFVTYIAETGGNEEQKAMARAVLKTQALDYERWYE